MSIGGADPNAVLGKFLDNQRRQEQFSEDIRKIMYSGPGGTIAPVGTRGSAGRVRSPGLAAGAALALGGVPASACDAHREAREQCRQAVENSRRSTCPFDDHTAFGASSADRVAPVRIPLAEREEVVAATQASRNLGKYNRDIAQKIGAGAPFDAPYDDTFTSSSNSMAGAQGGGRRGRGGGVPPVIPAQTHSVTDARVEAAANKTRMRGQQDLLGGYEFPLQGQQAQTRRNASLPPRPQDSLLPQAMMKLQYDGGSIKNITCARSEYLNSKVLAEANRDRNSAGVILG